MQWLRRKLRHILVWLLHEDFDQIVHQAVIQAREVSNRSNQRIVADVRRQLTALQALDVRFHETGKIVLIARLGAEGQGVVKSIDIPDCANIAEYCRLLAQLEKNYGLGQRGMHAPCVPDNNWVLNPSWSHLNSLPGEE
jgi:hypothetical protein